MNLLNRLSSQFYKTPVFKGLFNNYIQDSGYELVTKSMLEDNIEKGITDRLPQMVTVELQKAEALKKKDAMRYRVPMNFNQFQNPDKKFLSDIPFSWMRRMAIMYPIARACINRRKTQITQLDWTISPIDDDLEIDPNSTEVKLIKEWLNKPMGHKTRFREFISVLVDDLLTIDAVAFEIRKTLGGGFINLVPVDPSTIVLRVDETGGTPEPPETAYVQVIQGQRIAAFTTDEMIYDFLNSRSYTPYGLSPLESLIFQVESALRGTMFNLNYLRENNVPEGFITLPEEIASDADQIAQWQEWFDSIMAGNARTIHRLKVLPNGSEYTPAKKPDDMAFEKFEMWLLQQTCAVFDVQPQDIGVTYQVNKATSDTQQDLSHERGLFPLANFIKEIIDSVIHEQLGFTELEFGWTNLNPVDKKEEIEVAEKEIKMGALSVDEYRSEHGREPIGLEHYIQNGAQTILVKDFLTQKADPEVKVEEKQMDEIKAWRKAIYSDLKKGRPLRTKFPSQFIDSKVHAEIQLGLEKVHSKDQAKALFDRYTEPSMIALTKLLKLSTEMRKIENAELY